MATTTTKPTAYDVIVVGGSFAGLSAAMQLARARRRVCVVDAGQPRNRFAAASHGFFGQDGEPPLAMIAQARSKLATYPTVVFVRGMVVQATAAVEAPDSEQFSGVRGAFTSRWRAAHLPRRTRTEVATSRGSRRRRRGQRPHLARRGL